MKSTYETFRELSQLLSDEEKQMSLSRLAVKYQQSHEECILAHIYCSFYYYFQTQLNKYFYLTDEDKESILLQELWKAIEDYDETKGAEVQTLINRYLNRRLYAESSMCNHQKRILNYISASYEEEFIGLSNTTEIKSGDNVKSNTNLWRGRVPKAGSKEKSPTDNNVGCNIKNEDKYSEIELLEALKQIDLTENEISCCKIIIEENHDLTNTEIGKKIGKTSAGVKYIKDRLKRKLQPILDM